MTIAVDRDALTDAASTDLNIQTVDEFALRLIESELFDDIFGKCKIDLSLTKESNLQIGLIAVDDSFSEFCEQKSEVCEHVLLI